MADKDNNGISSADAAEWAARIVNQSNNGSTRASVDASTAIANVQTGRLQSVMENVNSASLLDLEKSAKDTTVIFTDQSKKASEPQDE